MYNKQEASAVRQKFWTRFGKYMAPVPSASGEQVNWINYKTGIKDIFFKMDSDNNRALVAIEISLTDKLIQQQYFHLFTGLEKQFQAIAGSSWDFQIKYINEHGKESARISAELNDVNIFRESDWPAIISFLKERIMALDAFWAEYKDVFEMSV